MCKERGVRRVACCGGCKQARKLDKRRRHVHHMTERDSRACDTFYTPTETHTTAHARIQQSSIAAHRGDHT